MGQMHTPGPWEARERGAVIAVCKGFAQSPVAKAEGRETKAEREANARLIAAAPDLLRLLTEVRKWMDADIARDPWEPKFCAEIDAVLTKATEGRP